MTGSEVLADGGHSSARGLSIDVQTLAPAIVSGPGTISLMTLDTPAPLAGEVEITVTGCGICGSNLHHLRNPSLVGPDRRDRPGGARARSIGTSDCLGPWRPRPIGSAILWPSSHNSQRVVASVGLASPVRRGSVTSRRRFGCGDSRTGWWCEPWESGGFLQPSTHSSLR